MDASRARGRPDHGHPVRSPFLVPVRTKLANPDFIAENLIRMGLQARRMPPAWDVAGISHLVAGPQGQYIGKLLPGRGIYVDVDLKSLGITKPPPFVYERSRYRRILDVMQRRFDIARVLDPLW